MSKTGSTSTVKQNHLKCWDGAKWVYPSARCWDGAKWVDVPVKCWNGSSWTVLNEGTYQTVWYADWSETYAYLDKAESNKDHGVKRNRPPVTLQRKKGSHFMYQGWWTSDPHGKMGSLMGFREDLIQKQLKGAVIEKVELYIRNIHSYYSTGQTAHIYMHNYKSEPDRIKKNTAFPSANKLGAWSFYRGASVQRTNSPVSSDLNWKTGYGTGLAKYDNKNILIEGDNSKKKVWLTLSKSVGEKFRDGKVCGFGIFENSANSQGESYGYWCGSEITPQGYLDMESVNRISGFDKNVSWKPQLRITYKKLNG